MKIINECEELQKQNEKIFPEVKKSLENIEKTLLRKAENEKL